LRRPAEDLGFKVIDCDALARVAVEKDRPGYLALIDAFGEGILNSDGTINRKALAQKAFSTAQNTELLNKTLLPHIVELIKSEFDRDRILLDAPTLFESGVNTMCNATVGVLAESEIRLERIMERDGIDKESALLRMNAGKPDGFYQKNADFIICNNGDAESFKNEFSEILNNIIKER